MAIKNTIKKIALTALVAASLISMHPKKAGADSIYKGVRGPTNWQLDERIGYAERDTSPSKTTTAAENTILKYWSGDKTGIFGFANIPGKYTEKGENSSSGIGDIALGIGPRGKLDFGTHGSLNFLSYAGLTLPTGDDLSKPSLGTGRLDERVGLFATYLSQNKKFETGASFEYTFTGEDRFGRKASDELALGIVSGGEVAKNLRMVGGLTGIVKQGGKNDGDYSIGPRVNIRYTFSPRMHAELIADYFPFERNMPSGLTITALARFNLGKIPGK